MTNPHLRLFIDLTALFSTSRIAVSKTGDVWTITIRGISREFIDGEYSSLLSNITTWIASLKN